MAIFRRGRNRYYYRPRWDPSAGKTRWEYCGPLDGRRALVGELAQARDEAMREWRETVARVRRFRTEALNRMDREVSHTCREAWRAVVEALQAMGLRRVQGHWRRRRGVPSMAEQELALPDLALTTVVQTLIHEMRLASEDEDEDGFLDGVAAEAVQQACDLAEELAGPEPSPIIRLLADVPPWHGPNFICSTCSATSGPAGVETGHSDATSKP